MPLTRRSFTQTLTISAAAFAMPRAVLWAAEPQSDLGISHTADSIHQTSVLKATPARVYAALTDAKQFDGVAKRSDAMKTMSLKSNPSVISTDAGAAFALFGGYVTGRQIELVPDRRIVQVWRAGSWKAGEYSLVKFELTAQGANTMLTLDHTGFPAGLAQHLAEGWHDNYLQPLALYLES
jgi:activator of HSP90 ATPase